MARIVSVYTSRQHRLTNMSYIRWYRMAAAIARRGHSVDIAVGETFDHGEPGVRQVPLEGIRFRDYDVVKVSYDEGLETLSRFGGAEHPFLLTRFGTVVGSEDQDGIPFRGAQRQRLFEAQARAHRSSRVISLLNETARDLWTRHFGDGGAVVIVPGAVDGELPPSTTDPFAGEDRVVCLFAGNLSSARYNPEVNTSLVAKLNAVGHRLAEQGARLYVMGSGTADALDPRYVEYLGEVQYERSWDYLRHAQVGLELLKCDGFMHNNESSKIYHYLRAGLPVVTPAGIPNSAVVTEAGLGVVVEGDDPGALASAVLRAARSEWDRERAVEWVVRHHSWDARAGVYDALLRDRLS